MIASPTQITADRTNKIFRMTWPDGRSDEISFHALRSNCPCAACVEEFTGKRLLNPDSVPRTIEPLAVELAGNYALKIRWSDGHDTGLFTWDHLRRLCDRFDQKDQSA